MRLREPRETGEFRMGTSDDSEHVLIAKAAAGDQAALWRLLLEYRDRLLTRITRRIPADLRERLDAEEVLVQTFAYVFRTIGSFQSQGKNAFGGWLVTIAEHKMIDQIRRLRRSKLIHEERAVTPNPNAASGSAASLIAWLAIDSHTPSRSAARHEAAYAVQLALASLPDRQQKAIRLVHVEEMSLAAAAKEMECTEGMVRGLCHRGKKKLHETLRCMLTYLSANSQARRIREKPRGRPGL